MKIYRLLVSLGVIGACAAGELRQIPLEVESFSGCYMERGVLKLHRQLPTQCDRQTITLEAENAMSLFFQEDVFARKSGDRADTLIQIKQKADEYRPQKSSEASGGKYIDYCSLGSYQFNLTASGQYTVWFRMWVPVKGQWNFGLNLDGQKREIELLDFIPQAKQWFWVKGPSFKLSSGNHQLRLTNLLNGKRLDCIYLTCNANWSPQGVRLPDNTTEIKTIRQGEIIFKTLNPIGLKSWQKLHYTQTGAGECTFYRYDAPNRAWHKLTSSALDQLGTQQNQPLRLQLKIRRQGKAAPEISNLAASYRFDDRSFARLSNAYQELFFARSTGQLAGIVNTATHREYHPIGLSSTLFELLLKRPGNKEKIWLDQKNAKLLKITNPSARQLQLHWSFPQYNIAVKLTLTAVDQQQIEWKFQIINANSAFDVIEVIAPKIAELRISDDAAQDTLVWPFSAGEFIPAPATHGEHSVIYPDHAGLPYVDLYNAQEGFYFGCHDPLLVVSQFVSKANYGQNAIELSVNRKHRIKAGTQQTYHFVTACHRGDWHAGARIYRSYFYQHYPLSDYCTWLRDADAWVQGSSCGHTGLMKRTRSYRAFIKDFQFAAFLGVNYIQGWGSTVNGACPNYYLPRQEFGGAKLFAEMMQQWRQYGGHIGHYFHGNSITPYYSLSKKYFETPWQNYAPELRPPSFEWLVRNREYMAGAKLLDKNYLLRQTAKLNKIHDQRQVICGNVEESYTGRVPMSWRSPEFANFLAKWVRYYIDTLHCDTAYLDTFAFRNDYADFNPYLKLNGEGDKPMLKVEFLNQLFRDMRQIEPDFSALTEGVADAFGAKLYFLLSGFARNPNIYRYTLPDHIFFQGSCNGQWTKPLTRKNIQQAFMTGNRYDLVVMFPRTYYMVKLRQRISPFLNRAVFDDNVGISSTVPELEAYAHLMLPTTDKIIPNAGTRAVTLTVTNPTGKPGQITYQLPQGFAPRYAVVCELYQRPHLLKLERQGNTVSFAAPRAEVAAVILIEKTAPLHQWTAIVEQEETGRFFTEIFNFSDQPIACQISALGQQKKLNIAAGKMGITDFADTSGSTVFKVVPVEVTSSGKCFKTVISLGESNNSIPVPELSAARPRPAVKPRPAVTVGATVLDMTFDGNEFDTTAPYQGTGAFKLTGNGQYRQKKFALKLEPECDYRLTLAIKKSFDLSPVNYHNFVTVSNYTSERKLEVYARVGLDIPRDNKWHTVATNFRTSKKLNNCDLYLYNRDSTQPIWIDAVKIVKLK